jgi:hypothetical protein
MEHGAFGKIGIISSSMEFHLMLSLEILDSRMTLSNSFIRLSKLVIISIIASLCAYKLSSGLSCVWTCDVNM